jgi:hypothetical protein
LTLFQKKKKCSTLHDPKEGAPDVNRTHGLSLSNFMSRSRSQTRIVIVYAGGLRAAAIRKLYRHYLNLNRKDKKCVPGAYSYDFSSFFALILLREVI